MSACVLVIFVDDSPCPPFYTGVCTLRIPEIRLITNDRARGRREEESHDVVVPSRRSPSRLAAYYARSRRSNRRIASSFDAERSNERGQVSVYNRNWKINDAYRTASRGVKNQLRP